MRLDLGFFKTPNYHLHQLMIHSYDVDLNKRLTLPSLFNYFQEIAWEHAGILKFGIDDLSKNNQFWVLSRVRVEVNRLPLWTENITLITYPRGVDGLFALRDYEMYDSKGERIISASSSWIVLNAENHRPVKLTGRDLDMFSNTRSALTVNSSKIPDINQTPFCTEKFVVKIGDIDVNLHVNNTRYLDWTYNAFSFDHYRKFAPKIVEVNFLAEGKENDGIELNLYSLSNFENIASIKREIDSKDLCRVFIKWEAIN
ncbi:MAG: acyl-[acyl-carrier-protein] thioesterase [Tenuifilaceae bacterium]